MKQVKQQRQVTETIVREMPKLIRNDTRNHQTRIEWKNRYYRKYKKAEGMIHSGEWVIVNE